jgi:hypothetical protein
MYPFMYVPVRLLPSNNQTVSPDVLAQSMVNAGEAYLNDNLNQRLGRSEKRIGKRHVDHLYYDDFIRLTK